jgi:uncharacterized metal-binding protein
MSTGVIRYFEPHGKLNEILGFELNNITENQDGVDEATGKLTQILHSISDKACKTFHKSRRKKRKKKPDNRGQIM